MSLAPAKAASKRPNILIVEDEFLIRAMLSETLRDAGYDVMEASSGDEAWLILSEQCPDLIVTDVRMPGSTDGIQLAEKVREANPRLPIIITSAHLLEVENSPKGPTQFLSKPYEFNVLIEVIALEVLTHRSS